MPNLLTCYASEKVVATAKVRVGGGGAIHKGIIVIGKITRLLIVWVIPLGVRLALIP